VRELELEDDVALPGFLRNPYPYLAGADLYASASTSEALPTAMIEALACGTPVVATDCRSGPAEILDGGRWGRLVPERDPESLANAMLATLDRPPDPDQLRSRAADFGGPAAIQRYRTVLGV
jgi:glycosyltransferase involved in cell wall biosynthesis